VLNWFANKIGLTFSNSSTLKNISRIAGANIFASSIGVIGTLVQARYVSPDQLGYFRSFDIVTGYVFFLHLGIFGAFQRYYPYYIGKGETAKANDIVRVSFSWNILISIIAGGLFFLFSLYSLFTGNWKAFLGWIVQVIIIVNYFYGGHLAVLFNSTQNFKKLSVNTFISSVVSIFTLPFFLLWPYIAMALRSGLGSIVSFIYLHISSLKFKKFRFRFKFSEWYSLVKEGFPMFTASYIAGIGWDTLEKSLILLYAGTHGLGLWSISFMLLSMMKLAPQSITAIYIPKIIENYGKTHDLKQGLQLCYKPMLWSIPFMLLLIILIIVLMPFLLPVIMPKYAGAIPLISIMIFILPLSILELPYTLLIAMGKVWQQNIIAISGIIAFLLITFIAVKMGFGLYGIIIASIIGKIMKLLTIYYFLLKAKKKN
jgi:O-antigen/teichoic acid export membrane protein